VRVQVLEIVELIGTLPYGVGEKFCSREVPVLDDEFCTLGFGMAFEISPHQLAIPSPVVLGICSGMYPDKTSPGLDIAFKGDFLTVVEYIARGAEKDHS